MLKSNSLSKLIFTEEVSEKLQYYIYMLIDPRNEKPFYVGKGKGNRVFEHIKHPNGPGEKAALIREIMNDKRIDTHARAPKVVIVRHGIASESAAFDIEAAIIDALGFDHLTNAVRGNKTQFGRMDVSDIIATYGAPTIAVPKGARIFACSINSTYRTGISDDELYHAARQFWHKVHRDVRKPNSEYKTALALFGGVVKAAYKIDAWYDACSTPSIRVLDPSRRAKRYEFEGSRDWTSIYLGRRLSVNGKLIQFPQNGHLRIET
jgi:hypothetical protein